MFLRSKRALMGSVLLIAIAVGIGTVAKAVAQNKPNVIVIVADDAGYADFGFSNGLSGTTSVVPTPSLDALARRGVTFSRSYVAQSCQPTRAALVTGGYQNRIGNEVVGDSIQGLPASATTIWDRMKSVGYSTGVIGKWHLGSVDGPQGNRPQTQGVDEFYGIWDGSRNYNVGGLGGNALQALRKTTVDPGTGNVTDTVIESNYSGQYITNTFGQLGIDYIRDHANQSDPFFLYQSFTAPHTPVGNSPDFNDPRLAGLSGVQKQYASMMLTMDKEIGRMLDRLNDPNGDGNTSDSIADNTMIVFVNDNGGAHAGSSSPNGADNGVLRQGKGTSYEGGIRVPMIIAGAGIDVANQGTIYNAPVHGIDILPTLFAAGGGSFGAGVTGIDGVNLLPFINGTNTSNPHDVLINRHREEFAVIKGDWKLVNGGGNRNPNQYQLYNLATDISETTNLRTSNLAFVEELKRDLTRYEAVFDKPRFAILGRTAEDTINQFDAFTFNPVAGGTSNWSSANAWVEAGTTRLETMFRNDSFAGAVLGFATSDSSNYVSNNDLVRETGLEFMLNKIVLSGNFNGTQNRNATIQGNSLLFTKSLAGEGPQLSIDATKSSSANVNNFTYNINTNLVMYDNLTIAGNGDVAVNINGQIRDYWDPRNLIKTGTSKVTLTGNNTYAGTTTIDGGTLALTGAATLANTSGIEVRSGATFDVSGTNSGGFTIGAGKTLNGSGVIVGNITAASGSVVAAGSSFGKLSISGNFTLQSGSALAIELGQGTNAGTDYDQLSVGGSLVLNGGDLVVMLGSGFTPSAGDAFNILDFSAISGGFGGIFLPTLATGLSWNTSALTTSGTLSVVSSVPEPGCALLLGATVCFGATRRRRV